MNSEDIQEGKHYQMRNGGTALVSQKAVDNNKWYGYTDDAQPIEWNMQGQCLDHAQYDLISITPER